MSVRIVTSSQNGPLEANAEWVGLPSRITSSKATLELNWIIIKERRESLKVVESLRLDIRKDSYRSIC